MILLNHFCFMVIIDRHIRSRMFLLFCFELAIRKYLFFGISEEVSFFLSFVCLIDYFITLKYIYYPIFAMKNNRLPFVRDRERELLRFVWIIDYMSIIEITLFFCCSKYCVIPLPEYYWSSSLPRRNVRCVVRSCSNDIFLLLRSISSFRSIRRTIFGSAR